MSFPLLFVIPAKAGISTIICLTHYRHSRSSSSSPAPLRHSRESGNLYNHLPNSLSSFPLLFVIPAKAGISTIICLTTKIPIYMGMRSTCHTAINRHLPVLSCHLKIVNQLIFIHKNLVLQKYWLNFIYLTTKYAILTPMSTFKNNRLHIHDRRHHAWRWHVALPLVSAGSGFLVAALALCLLWAMMCYTALLILEINIHFPLGTSFGTMAYETLGALGQVDSVHCDDIIILRIDCGLHLRWR